MGSLRLGHLFDIYHQSECWCYRTAGTKDLTVLICLGCYSLNVLCKCILVEWVIFWVIVCFSKSAIQVIVKLHPIILVLICVYSMPSPACHLPN